MKKVILSVILFCYLVTSAQVVTERNNTNTVHALSDSDVAKMQIGERRLDTVPVFLLVADLNVFDSIGHTLKVVRAYSVRAWHTEAEDDIYWSLTHPSRKPLDYPVHVHYLDSSKEPLRSNILYWKPANDK